MLCQSYQDIALIIKYDTMKMKYLKLLCCLICINLGAAAQNNQKLSKSIKVDKDVTIDLNTNYVQLEIDTWNRNEIQVEAYIDDQKLSGEELKKALDNWKLKVEGSGDYVSIKSEGSYASWDDSGDFPVILESLNVLADIDLELAEIPDIPELPEMPEIPEMVTIEMPEVPQLPELPELPEGVTNVSFDTEKYEKDGEAYLERWSKEYEAKFGKQYKEEMKAWAREMAKVDFKSYEKQMKEWGERFGKRFGDDYAKKMEAWGIEFSERFDDEWAEKMEAWGEKYGAKMESKQKAIEKRAKAYEERAKAQEERAKEIKKRVKLREERVKAKAKGYKKKYQAKTIHRSDDVIVLRGYTHDKTKKVIKIKMPKKAKLKMNVRHGELKFSSLIENLKADLEHTSLVANHIDGSSTSINVAYSPVEVSLWSQGELNLKYVEDAHILNAKRLMLNSNSSNIIVDKLSGNAIIDGSFGDLVISEITEDFSNLNIVLENSDAFITLPKTDYNVYFKGHRSKLNNKTTTQKTIESPLNGKPSKRSIVLNAKYSNLIFKE